MVMLRPVDRREAARYLGYRDTEPDEIISGMMDECEKELFEAAKPAYTVGIFETEAAGESKLCLKDCTLVLTGNDIVKHLEGCGMAALIAATLGGGVDMLLRRLQVTSMPKALVADAMAGAMLEQVLNDIQAELAEKLPNMRQTWRFSPGYGDLPLTVQPDFLKVVEAGKRIGLSVTEGNMLTPVKSVTAIVGLQDMTKISGHFSMDTPEELRTAEKTVPASAAENGLFPENGPEERNAAKTAAEKNESKAGASEGLLASPTGCSPASCAKCAYHEKCTASSRKG